MSGVNNYNSPPSFKATPFAKKMDEDNLVVFYYFIASEIWSGKEGCPLVVRGAL